MSVAFIGIGSNVGDRSAFVRRAIDELRGATGVAVEETSSLYETSPIGGPPQRSFVNLVARISTTLTPQELLAVCKEIEHRLGREESDIRWGPRVVDLDILLFDQEKVSEPELEIPHPRLTVRKFALVPLLELDPELTDPWGMPYREFVDEAEGDVELLEAF
ncbi:MAG TPA: 2-amino-4-hydroxy-6-hydroxymethyldihydropteridine diphosphokinase [Actinomycetota bacterium]